MRKNKEKGVTFDTNEVKFKFDISHSPLKRKNMFSVINQMTPESGLSKAICYMIDSIKLTNNNIRSKLDLNFHQPNYEILNKLREEFKQGGQHLKENNKTDSCSSGLTFESKYIKMTDEEKQKILGQIEEDSDIRKENYQVMIESIKENMVEMMKEYQNRRENTSTAKLSTPAKVIDNEDGLLKPRTVQSTIGILSKLSSSSGTLTNKNVGRLENIRALNKKEIFADNDTISKIQIQQKELLTRKTISRITQLKRATNIGITSHFNYKKSSTINSPNHNKHAIAKKMSTSQSRSSNRNSTNRSMDSRKSRQSTKMKVDMEKQKSFIGESGIYPKKSIMEENTKHLGTSINKTKISIESDKNIILPKGSLKTSSDQNSPSNKKVSVRFDVPQYIQTNEQVKLNIVTQSISFSIDRQEQIVMTHQTYKEDIIADIMTDDKPLRVRSSHMNRENNLMHSDKESIPIVIEFDYDTQNEKKIELITNKNKPKYSLENFEINLTSEKLSTNKQERLNCSGGCCSWKSSCVII